MAKVRSPWRMLRPLLLAGAVTATWLTLSSSAATADSSTESGSLLGGVTSSVSSISGPVTGNVSPLLETKSPPAPTAAAGLVQPAVSSLAHTTDQLVAAVPIAKSIVPSGTITAVAVPVAAATDRAVAGLAEVTVPPLVEAVPILEPVVQPVTDVVTGATPLPDALPGVLAPSGDVPEVLVSDTTSLGASTEVSAPAAVENAETVAHSAADLPGTSLASTGSSAAGTSSASFHPATHGTPLSDGPSPSPVPAPALPGSGAGSGASPSGSSGAAAWLNDFDLTLPLSGAFPISGASKHSPSPVSFDPGSSPD